MLKGGRENFYSVAISNVRARIPGPAQQLLQGVTAEACDHEVAVATFCVVVVANDATCGVTHSDPELYVLNATDVPAEADRATLLYDDRIFSRRIMAVEVHLHHDFLGATDGFIDDSKRAGQCIVFTLIVEIK